MNHCMTQELKQIQTEMKALRNKIASGRELTQNEQATFDELAAERDEIIMSQFLPVYYQPFIIPFHAPPERPWSHRSGAPNKDCRTLSSV